MIEFLRGKAYLEWDPSNPSLVPGIPSWTVSFGEIQISFKEGEKKCVVTKKPCGDYVIIFTYKKYKRFFNSYPTIPYLFPPLPCKLS